MAAIVMLVRIKPNFWSALDGNVDLGFSFTQQNSKTDINFSTAVSYKKGLNNDTICLESILFSSQYRPESASIPVSPGWYGFPSESRGTLHSLTSPVPLW
jgi:hypothetical protein